MFGFLKEKLKQTVEKFTKEVDKATKKVTPTEEQKKEIIEEIKQEQKEQQEKKGFFGRFKERFSVLDEKEPILKDEGYGLEVIKEDVKEEKPEDIKKRIEEGEKEIEALAAKKELEQKQREEEKRKRVDKKEKEEKEERGFFSRLKEKFIRKEEPVEVKREEKKDELFTTTTEELREFEEAFKEAKTGSEIKESEEKEDIIPVITETEQGETIVELHKKPSLEKEKKKKEIQKKKPLPTKKEEKIVEEEPEEIGFLSALKDTLFKTSLSEEKFEELFWNLELILLENNVAVEVIDLIKANLKKELVEKKILRGQTNEIIIKTLRKSIEQTFDVQPLDLFEKIRTKKPFVIVFVGVNGSGKTTTIAKIAQLLKENNLSCVVAAGDTFRAAAIQQLEEHTKRLNVKLIKHDYGSDPAAVGFDAIKYAQAHGLDCVLIDTAGRLHSNVNLMDEMKKIIRVTKPDLKLFIGEAITGNDCVDQARRFHDAIGIDGIILAKADVDEKGGAALSVSYVTGKPILFLGTGQNYGDLEKFDREKIIEQLGLA